MTACFERLRILNLAMLGLLIVFAGGKAEANQAGKVIFAKGSVSAERAPPERLAKGDPVLVNDAIVTGDTARAQLLMLDGAKIAVRPNSRLLIEEFLYPKGVPVAKGKPVASTSGDRAVYRLIKGGFRSITGAIGKEKEEDYQVRTPVGVLGIRGTDYTVLLCQDDCDSEPEAGGSSLQNGLHISVTSGIVVFHNAFGDFEITAGQKYVIPLIDSRPQRSTTSGDSEEEDSEEGSTDEEPPETPKDGTDSDGKMADLHANPDPGNRTISWSSGPLIPDRPDGFAGVQDNTPDEYVLDNSNNLEGFDGPYPQDGPNVRATFEIGAAANVNTGFDSVTLLRWGRWSGGTANITLETGADVSLDLSTQSLHWISGPEWMTLPVMPITGAADYSLIGNTSPTNNLGDVGVVGSATFVADFTNMLVFSTLDLEIAGDNWAATGNGNIGAGAGLPAHQFAGIYTQVSHRMFDAVFPGSGGFSGFFSEPGNPFDPNWPGGVGLTYALLGFGGEWVSGALIFGDAVTAQPGDRTISWSSGELSPNFIPGFAASWDNTVNEYVLDAGNDLEGFDALHPTATGGVTLATFGIGTASNVESGFHAATMLRWGRWSGGIADITLSDSTDVSLDLSMQSIHWIEGPEWRAPPVLPMFGAADYTLIGNTSPTNNFGDVGILGSASFLADFTNLLVYSDLDLDIAGNNWTASGVGNIGGHLFSGNYGKVNNSGSGSFSGFFSDPGDTADPDWPGGVGLTYTLTDNDGFEWVSGALIFGDPVAPPPGLRSVSWSSAPLSPYWGSGFAAAQDDTVNEYVVDADNNLVGFVAPYPTDGPNDQATFEIGTAANVDTGFDSVTMLRWGRWSGGTASIMLDSGNDASQDLSQESLHWISGPEWILPPVMPIFGAADYTLIGNTSPINQFGEVGVVGSASFLADFTNLLVYSDLTLDMPDSSWDASGVGDIGGAGVAAHLFSGFYTVMVSSATYGSGDVFGSFSGFFSQPGNTPDPNVPGGVGLTYTMTGVGADEVVSGALIFGDPVAVAVPPPPVLAIDAGHMFSGSQAGGNQH